MNSYCTFYIVRHAQSEANVSGEWGANTSLTPLGRQQAQKRSKQLSKIPLAAIFSSDYLRAKQTAEIIALEHKIEVRATEILRERFFGSLEKTNYFQWNTDLKNLFETWYNKEYDERLKEKPVAGMESDEEMISRAITFLRETALVYPGKNVLVATHGDLMQTLLVHLGYGRHREYHFEAIINTAYAVVRCDGVDFFVDSVEDIELLKDE